MARPPPPRPSFRTRGRSHGIRHRPVWYQSGWALHPFIPQSGRASATIHCPLPFPVRHYCQPKYRPIQEHALNFARVINLFLSTFADASISIEWTPATPALEATVKRKPGNARNSQTKKKKLESSYQRRPRRRDQERRRTSSGGGVARQTPHLCGIPTLPPQIPG